MFGLRADLIRCLVYATEKEKIQEIEEDYTIPDFTLGQYDLTVALHFVPKLCGRDTHVQILKKALEDTVEGKKKETEGEKDKNGPSVVFVSGSAGTGKSMLVTSSIQLFQAQSQVSILFN